MNWMIWIVVAWFAYSSVAVIGNVGKEREPIKPSTAVASLVISVVMVGLVVVGSVSDV